MTMMIMVQQTNIEITTVVVTLLATKLTLAVKTVTIIMKIIKTSISEVKPTSGR